MFFSSGSLKICVTLNPALVGVRLLQSHLSTVAVYPVAQCLAFANNAPSESMLLYSLVVSSFSFPVEKWSLTNLTPDVFFVGSPVVNQ